MKIACKLSALVVAAAVAVVAPGCGSLQRAGKDIAVVVTSPVTILLSAGKDSLDWPGKEANGAVPIVLFPFNFPLQIVKHVAYTLVYAVDLCVSPLYLPASIPPKNDLKPIDIYSLTDGYPWKAKPWPVWEE